MAPSLQLSEEDTRCSWSLSADDYVAYHDEEWGVPLYDDQRMFEFLLLETFQAGLSWLLILRRRAAFREAFHSFKADRVAEMTEADVERLVNDQSIVRNRLKIQAAIANARAVVTMRDRDRMGLAEYFWRTVGFVPVDTGAFSTADVPSCTDLSERVSKDLKRRGFRFVGPTVVYAHLQATGIVNDHVVQCPRYSAVKKAVRTESEWRQAGVDVGVMGDASRFWEKVEAEAKTKARPRRKRKAEGSTSSGRKSGQEKGNPPPRRSSRIADKSS